MSDTYFVNIDGTPSGTFTAVKELIEATVTGVEDPWDYDKPVFMVKGATDDQAAALASELGTLQVKDEDVPLQLEGLEEPEPEPEPEPEEDAADAEPEPEEDDEEEIVLVDAEGEEAEPPAAIEDQGGEPEPEPEPSAPSVPLSALAPIVAASRRRPQPGRFKVGERKYQVNQASGHKQWASQQIEPEYEFICAGSYREAVQAIVDHAKAG